MCVRTLGDAGLPVVTLASHEHEHEGGGDGEQGPKHCVMMLLRAPSSNLAGMLRALCLLGLSACGAQAMEAARPAASPATTASPGPAPSPSSAAVTPHAIVVSILVTHASEQGLRFCMDFTLVPVDGDDGSGLADAYASGLLAAGAEGSRVESCSSLPGKTVLATCTIDTLALHAGQDNTTNPLERRIKDVVIATNYYDPRDLTGEEMRKCAKENGDWRASPKSGS
jgi:hypothetical protein